MKEYLALADELEKTASVPSLDLEKVASLCLLYEYFNNKDFQLWSSPALIKRASDMLDEQTLGLRLGVEMGIQALTDGDK